MSNETRVCLPTIAEEDRHYTKLAADEHARHVSCVTSVVCAMVVSVIVFVAMVVTFDPCMIDICNDFTFNKTWP